MSSLETLLTNKAPSSDIATMRDKFIEEYGIKGEDQYPLMQLIIPKYGDYPGSEFSSEVY